MSVGIRFTTCDLLAERVACDDSETDGILRLQVLPVDFQKMSYGDRHGVGRAPTAPPDCIEIRPTSRSGKILNRPRRD